MEPLLEIRDLEVRYFTGDGVVEAVNSIDLTVGKGENLGLVGETGAGKTTTALSILRLLPDPPGKITGGSVRFNGEELLDKTEKEMRTIRGGRISMIFQDPMTALNPVIRVGEQIAEVILLHDHVSRAEAERRALEMLELMRRLREKLGTAMVLITHDLGVVAETCDRVAVMYAGEVVETGSLEDIFERAAHPYTVGLFQSIPSLDEDVDMLTPIPGLMPDPVRPPTGCKFHPRCPRAEERCAQACPGAVELSPGHVVRCLLYGGGQGKE